MGITINGEKLSPFFEEFLLHRGQRIHYHPGFKRVEPEFVVVPKELNKGINQSINKKQ